MCHGTVSAEDCLANNNNDLEALVVCDVEARTPASTPIQIRLPDPVPVQGDRPPLPPSSCRVVVRDERERERAVELTGRGWFSRAFSIVDDDDDAHIIVGER